MIYSLWEVHCHTDIKICDFQIIPAEQAKYNCLILFHITCRLLLWIHVHLCLKVKKKKQMKRKVIYETFTGHGIYQMKLQVFAKHIHS